MSHWHSDRKGYDRSIFTSEVLDTCKRLGREFAIRGSTKEQRFLAARGIHLVGVVVDQLRKLLED